MMRIYTDGSCDPNPGRGGWAWWCPTTRRHDSGHVAETTNNRMELQAILEAVKALDGDGAVHIYTDSQWALNVLTRRWKAKKNRDLIEGIWALPHWTAARLSWVTTRNTMPFPAAPNKPYRTGRREKAYTPGLLATQTPIQPWGSPS